MNTPPPVADTDRVVLAHGGGGALTDRLIRDVFLPALENDALAPLDDSAVLPWTASEMVFTTDSYVVTPLEFPGGDIGRLAVAGTVNDLAVMGATPVALSLGLIIEEGLPIETLRRVLSSIGGTCREANVRVVTGDTKVIEHRGSEGLFINTAGVGRMMEGLDLGLLRVEPGDAILVTGTIADHGLAIMSVRNDIRFETELRSDAAPLNGLLGELFSCGSDVKFVRDATRGGIAGVLADISEHGNLTVEVGEAALPISATARHAAEMMGLDPLTVANEGKCVCVVAGCNAEKALTALRSHPLGSRAAVVGRVTDAKPALVELITSAGGRRIVQRPYGEELPRIC